MKHRQPRFLEVGYFAVEVAHLLVQGGKAVGGISSESNIVVPVLGQVPQMANQLRTKLNLPAPTNAPPAAVLKK